MAARRDGLHAAEIGHRQWDPTAGLFDFAFFEVGRAPVAELAFPVVAPGHHAPVAEQREAMSGAGGNGRRPADALDGHRHRTAAVCLAVSQLTDAVFAPR